MQQLPHAIDHCMKKMFCGLRSRKCWDCMRSLSFISHSAIFGSFLHFVSVASRLGRSPPPGRRWVSARSPLGRVPRARFGCVWGCLGWRGRLGVVGWGLVVLGWRGLFAPRLRRLRAGALWVGVVCLWLRWWGVVRWRPSSLPFPPGPSPRALASLPPGRSPSPCLRAVH